MTDTTTTTDECAAFEPDPTRTPPPDETYARAYESAAAVLERVGVGRTFDGYIGERFIKQVVSLVLGAALLEFEATLRQLRKSTGDAERRGQLIDDVVRLLDGSQGVHVDVALAKLREELDR